MGRLPGAPLTALRRVLLPALLLGACARHSVRVEAEPEGIGAVEVFGRGIVALDGGGDRVLVAITAPAYIALVRLDALGAVAGGAASALRHDPGTLWLEVPSVRGRNRRVTAATAPPVCDDVSAGSRRQCLTQQSRTDMAVTPPGLAAGESLMLFLAADPVPMADLEARLNLASRRVPIPQLPGVVMDGRRGLWAAYLLRRS